jgi:hypothetical protein
VPSLRFSPHAEDQIAERRLSRDLVRQTVEEPEERVASGSRTVAQRVFRLGAKDYMIRAVYESQDEDVLIVTVYRTSKIAKYRGLR